MTQTEALRNVSIFADLEDSLLRLLAIRSRERMFSAGQLLMAQGEPGTSLHVLLEGSVSIERKTPSGQVIQISEQGAGNCFGEMSLIDGQGRSADVRALAECRVLIVDQDTFNQLVLAHPRAALAVMQTLVRRFREQAAELAQINAR